MATSEPAKGMAEQFAQQMFDFVQNMPRAMGEPEIVAFYVERLEAFASAQPAGKVTAEMVADGLRAGAKDSSPTTARWLRHASQTPSIVAAIAASLTSQLGTQGERPLSQEVCVKLAEQILKFVGVGSYWLDKEEVTKMVNAAVSGASAQSAEPDATWCCSGKDGGHNEGCRYYESNFPPSSSAPQSPAVSEPGPAKRDNLPCNCAPSVRLVRDKPLADGRSYCLNCGRAIGGAAAPAPMSPYRTPEAQHHMHSQPMKGCVLCYPVEPAAQPSTESAFKVSAPSKTDLTQWEDVSGEEATRRLANQVKFIIELRERAEQAEARLSGVRAATIEECCKKICVHCSGKYPDVQSKPDASGRHLTIAGSRLICEAWLIRSLSAPQSTQGEQ